MQFENPALLIPAVAVPAYMAYRDLRAAKQEAQVDAVSFPDPDDSRLAEGIRQRHNMLTRMGHYAAAGAILFAGVQFSGPETTAPTHPGEVATEITTGNPMYHNLADGKPAIVDAANGLVDKALASRDGVCVEVDTTNVGCIGSNQKSSSNIHTLRSHVDYAINPLNLTSSVTDASGVDNEVRSAVFNGANEVVIFPSDVLTPVAAADLFTLEQQATLKTKHAKGKEKYAIGAIILGNSAQDVQVEQSYASVLGTKMVLTANSQAEVAKDSKKLLQVTKVSGDKRPDHLPGRIAEGFALATMVDAVWRRMSGHIKSAEKAA